MATRGTRKLSEEDRRVIHNAPAIHGIQSAMARHFGVSRTRINQIIAARPWRPNAATPPDEVYLAMLAERRRARDPSVSARRSSMMRARWADPQGRAALLNSKKPRYPERATGQWYARHRERSVGWLLVDPHGIARGTLYGRDTAEQIAALLNITEQQP